MSNSWNQRLFSDYWVIPILPLSIFQRGSLFNNNIKYLYSTLNHFTHALSHLIQMSLFYKSALISSFLKWGNQLGGLFKVMYLVNGRLGAWTWALQHWICVSAPGLINQLRVSHTYSVSPIIITFSGSTHPWASCKMKLAIVYDIGSGLFCQLIYWSSHCEITCAVTPHCAV